LFIPGDFALTDKTPFYEAPSGTLLGDYTVHVDRLPRPVYIRDILYGGASVQHTPLRLGSQLAGSELRVILAHDGGMVKARVTDDGGEPVADATVVTVPKDAATHMQLAETRVAGPTDQNGEYTTPALPPGEYLVLSLEGDFTDLSPETIETVFNARSRAQEVNIGPNAMVELQLEVRRLER
jgi:hypothetical protein